MAIKRRFSGGRDEALDSYPSVMGCPMSMAFIAFPLFVRYAGPLVLQLDSVVHDLDFLAGFLHDVLATILSKAYGLAGVRTNAGRPM
jgi:hypothetical protein